MPMPPPLLKNSHQLHHFESSHLTLNKVLEIFGGYFLPEDGSFLSSRQGLASSSQE
jgi:hypothetical protein